MHKRTIDECRAGLKKLTWPREYRERGRVELRQAGDGKTIDMFVPYGSESVDLGFIEILEPGVFARSIRAGRSSRRSDIFALWSHDASQPLARQANDTLAITEREDGVSATATLIPEIDYHQRTLQLVRANLVRGTSFGFETVRDDWEYDEEGNAKRHVLEAKLHEFSPVVFPAYQESDAETRSAIAQLAAATGFDATELVGILHEASGGKVSLEQRDRLLACIAQLQEFVPAAVPADDYWRKKLEGRERLLQRTA